MAKIHLTSKTSAMKLYLSLLSSVLILASCTTAYKTGQTPDDVYFSPERQRDEYVRVEEKEDRQYRYQNEEEQREDRYLRMKTSYRRYSVLDDCDCYCYTGSNYNRYYDYYRHNNFGYNNNPWNNWGWNNYNPYYYNPYYNKPYYSGYIAGNVRPVYNKPRGGNLNVYGNGNNSNSNANTQRNNGKTYSSGPDNREDNYRGSGTNAGGFLRNIFNSGSNNNSNNNSSNTSTNTNTNSSSTNSGSSSSSGSSSGSRPAPARKF